MDDLESVLAAMAAEGWGNRPIGDCAAELRRRLDLLAARGAKWADARLERFEQDGARLYLKGWHDQQRKRWLGPDGKVLTTTASYAVPAQNTRTGAKIGGSREIQLQLMTWVEIEAKRASIATLRTRLDDVIRVLDLLETLHKRYPDATCPYEAMLLAGIDPDTAVVNLSKVI